ncbi:unnamed protein product [Dimorphilus gyrociliatus]|uniref:Uncharacterized protein n=1 Tax=Dimorphilus gyrociliatus TaxID=2664684 RepID=A0A7I8W942_9ANNE|nr:unnamed protein product [Dimorphilus gyrociliatus]
MSLSALLKCPICLDSFDKPLTLPCLHSFCENCLGNVVTHKSVFNCPSCREPIQTPKNGLNGFKKDFRLQFLLDFGSFCANCSSKPTLVCQDCTVELCSNCSTQHSKIPAFSNHVVYKRVECLKHKLDKKFYCSDCSSLLCTCCVFNQHSEHKISPISSLNMSLESKLKSFVGVKEALNFSAKLESPEERLKILKDALQNLYLHDEIGNFNAANVVDICANQQDFFCVAFPDRLEIRRYIKLDDIQQVIKLPEVRAICCLDSNEIAVAHRHFLSIYNIFGRYKRHLACVLPDVNLKLDTDGNLIVLSRYECFKINLSTTERIKYGSYSKLACVTSSGLLVVAKHYQINVYKDNVFERVLNVRADGLCSDDRGRLLISDKRNNSISLYTIFGEKITTILNLNRPKKIGLSPDGYLVTVQKGNIRIFKIKLKIKDPSSKSVP